MPELPEVEITARLIGAATTGAVIESALAPGLNAVKTYRPPLQGLAGATIMGIRRRGKLFLLDLESASAPSDSASAPSDSASAPADSGSAPADSGSDLTLVVHLMSAGRLQLFDKRAALRDKTSRVLLRLSDGERELRLREFGTKQRAWVKLLHRDAVEQEETLSALGPEAWPATPDPQELKGLLAQPRPLYALLRDQHVIAGIGRSWVDEILHTARLSPFKRGAELSEEEAAALAAAIHERLGGAVEYYEQTLAIPIPDKLPLPLTVHRQNGRPCPRCGTTIEAVFYEDYVMCYCPFCQTEGKVLKDRRLSRLLK